MGGLAHLGLWWGIRLGLQGRSSGIVQPGHGANMQAEHLNALQHHKQQHAVPAWACKDARGSAQLTPAPGAWVQTARRPAKLLGRAAQPLEVLVLQGLGHGVVVIKLCRVLVPQRVCLVLAPAPKVLDLQAGRHFG